MRVSWIREVLALAALMAVVRVSDASDDRLGDDDDESDPAPFMIVLEHHDGWQCAASLVSIRTGVTTARCARGREPRLHSAPRHARRPLWALAAALVSARPTAASPPSPAAPGDCARRVTRVALAGDLRDPADPALDVAVFELEAPFGAGARSRPILMATSREGCRNVSECHSVRALPPLSTPSVSETGKARFRVVNLSLAPNKHCVSRIPHWTASSSRLMCLTGDELCERDLGAGVVCGGKLCGILSAVGAEGAEGARGAPGAAPPCGDTFAAQSIARWRSFLHCAHTLRLCGRGACAEICTERILFEEVDDEYSDTTDSSSTITHSAEYTPSRSAEASMSHSIKKATRTGPSRRRPTRSSEPPGAPLPPAAPAPASLAVTEEEHHARPAEFEQNRADFRATPSRTTRVALKAGEYGDNAAEYGGEEPPPAARPPRPSPPSPRPAEAAHAPSPAEPDAPEPDLMMAVQTTSSSIHILKHHVASINLLIYVAFFHLLSDIFIVPL